jgi:predicted RNA-binding Zn ribbon-like protein
VEMDRTGPEGAEAGGFVFVGEALALDLVNTEVVVRGKAGDLLATPGAVAEWWRAVAARHPEAVEGAVTAAADLAEPALLPAVRELRRALRGLFGAIADGSPLDSGGLVVLNQALGNGMEVVEVGANGKARLAHRPRRAGPEALLLPIARSAAVLLTSKDPARLHRCGNERCVLLFYDTTKSATRRWCSVGCMNRARSSRRYRERKRGKSGASA